MKACLTCLLAILSLQCLGQQFPEMDKRQPETSYENIHVERLGGDSLSTSFMIWIKKGVPAHKHDYHTEHLYVIHGAGDLTLGNDTLYIKAGDVILIPKQTVHALTVKSADPVQVLSVQSPAFYGKDRVFVTE